MRLGNIERNSYVKKQIESATIKLLKEKELKSITVNDIAEKSNVSRVSFYRNYESKEDIIKSYIGRQLYNWYSHNKENFIKMKAETGRDDEMLGSLFGLLIEHKDLYLLLYKRGLLYFLHDTLRDIYGPNHDYPNFHAYLMAFFIYGVYGWIEEWISRGMQESAQEMTILLKMRNLND